MANAELKTKINEASVEDFLNGVADEGRRDDGFKVMELMRDVTGEEPKMWGTAIIGFGLHHLKYASGRELDSALVGFSPRKANLTLYITDGFDKIFTDFNHRRVAFAFDEFRLFRVEFSVSR